MHMQNSRDATAQHATGTPGLLSQTKQVTIGETNEPINFELDTSQLFRGTVVIRNDNGARSSPRVV